MIAKLYQSRQNALRYQCEMNLNQIGHLLKMYDSNHGSLPPAFLTDAAGRSVLSWRVRTAEYYRYRRKFSKDMDFSQPWDSPRNAAFLESLHATVFQCPALRKERRNVTDYVSRGRTGAPFGRARNRGKLPQREDLAQRKFRSPILVVEWPGSDIHWAEPRDITVDEFLDRFRSKSNQTPSNHRGGILYVDAAGKVDEIPDDTDPETARKILFGEPVEGSSTTP